MYFLPISKERGIRTTKFDEPVQNAPIKETPKELSLLKRRNNELQNEVQKLKRQILDMENQLSKWKGKYARAVTNDILKI